jgi:hypothetical protein
MDNDIPIFDIGDASPLPPDEVKIDLLEVEPYRDRFRIFIHVRVTPFMERPNLLLTARDERDTIVSELSIIETMHHDMEFTMHLRGLTDPTGLYTLTAELFYESRNPPQDEAVEAFEIFPAEESTDES